MHFFTTIFKRKCICSSLKVLFIRIFLRMCVTSRKPFMAWNKPHGHGFNALLVISKIMVFNVRSRSDSPMFTVSHSFCSAVFLLYVDDKSSLRLPPNFLILKLMPLSGNFLWLISAPSTSFLADMQPSQKLGFFSLKQTISKHYWTRLTRSMPNHFVLLFLKRHTWWSLTWPIGSLQ